jgi:ABC-2 type transport system ATP-binding protein
MNHEYFVELSKVEKKFAKTIALDGVDLAVKPGELLAILGPNGAGKTTAISLMLGLTRPDTGEVTLLGEAPQSLRARRQIGVMMQEVYLAPELRVREQIDLVASYYPDPLSPEAAMEMTGTAAIADRAYGRLSGGQKRQVQFAMAICGRPRLLFLDEPSVGLDVHARQAMWSALRQLLRDGVSIVLTTHYLEEAEALAHRVAVLAKGRVIASGSVCDLHALIVRKHVSCRSILDIEQVKSWPTVESAHRDRAYLRVATSDAELIVQRLMAADPGLSELEVRRAGLSEVFTHLTGDFE